MYWKKHRKIIFIILRQESFLSKTRNQKATREKTVKSDKNENSLKKKSNKRLGKTIWNIKQKL